MEDREVMEAIKRLTNRVQVLERIVGRMTKGSEDSRPAASINQSKKILMVGSSTYLFDWYQNVDEDIRAFFRTLPDPASFKPDHLCSTVIEREFLLRVARKVSDTPSLTEHWEAVNFYPFALGRFVPLVSPSESSNGLRILYEKMYFHLYNRARIILAKDSDDNNVVDLTRQVAEMKSLTETKPLATQPIKREGESNFPTETQPAVIVIEDSDDETPLKGKLPTVPPQVPIGTLQRGSESVTPTKPPPKKRPPVSPVAAPDSPVRKPVAKKTKAAGKSRGRRTATKRTLFKEEKVEKEESTQLSDVDFPIVSSNVEPPADDEAPGNSSEEEVKQPQKRSHKPSESLLASLEQASSPERDSDSDTEETTQSGDLQHFIASFLSFHPTTSQMNAGRFQFAEQKELVKALRPLRNNSPTPADLFIALATTSSERLKNAPAIGIQGRGNADARKKLAVYSFRFYPGLSIAKGVPDPLSAFKLYFDAVLAFNVSSSLQDLETVQWKRLLVATGLLWQSVSQLPRIIETFHRQGIDFQEGTDLKGFLQDLPPASWDKILDTMLSDLAGCPQIEKPSSIPSEQIMKNWMIHPYMWSTARHVKVGVCAAPSSLAPSTTPKQVNLRFSLLLWSLFPQATEVPSLIAFWTALYLGVDVSKLRLKPAVPSPLWKMCWDAV